MMTAADELDYLRQKIMTLLYKDIFHPVRPTLDAEHAKVKRDYEIACRYMAPYTKRNPIIPPDLLRFHQLALRNLRAYLDKRGCRMTNGIKRDVMRNLSLHI